MSEKDKIYELFRQNEHKLSEKPSRRAWERVDARLDRHYAKRQSPMWLRYGGMVAALMILVLTASLLVMNNNTSSADNQVAFNNVEEKSAPSTPLLDFKEKGNIDNHMRIVAYQNEYKNRANRISENSIAGDLRPRGGKKLRKGVVDEERNDEFDEAIAFNDEVAEEKIEVRALDKTVIIEEVAQNMVTVAKPEMLDVELKEEAEKEKPLGKDEKVVGKKKESEAPKRSVAIADAATSTTPEPVANAVMPAAPAKGNADYEVDLSVEESPAVIEEIATIVPETQFEINSDDGGFMDMEDEIAEERLSLSDFSWILGSWKGKVNGSTSKEVWKKVSETTYKGKGTLIGGGTTLFSEKMELRITDVGTYLTISLGKDNKRVAYRMTSNNGYTIVFTNNSVEYPKKIILTKKADDTFSLVMKTGDTESLDNEQVNYLENRNVIEGSNMIRSLRKDD